MKKTDPEIQQAVITELKWDTRVEETDVGVQVSNGIVTLSGSVGSWAKRLAAQEAAHRVAGVHDVANELKVKIPGSAERSDTDIARAVRSALEWDDFVIADTIQSTVSNGWLTLEGEVEYWSEREDAERAVRNLTGVKGITNKIKISPPSLIQADVEDAIGDALARRAEREAERIGVKVTDGRVKLSGRVHSLAEKNAVLGAARATPGVRAVEADLRIQP